MMKEDKLTYDDGFREGVENCINIINEELPSSIKVQIRREMEQLFAFIPKAKATQEVTNYE